MQAHTHTHTHASIIYFKPQDYIAIHGIRVPSLFRMCKLERSHGPSTKNLKHSQAVGKLRTYWKFDKKEWVLRIALEINMKTITPRL